MPSARTALLSTGEESEKAITELEQLFKVVENEIKEKKFFGGNNIGFLDIVALVVAFWIPCMQEFTAKNILTKEKYQLICIWSEKLLGCSIIKQNLPDKEKLREFYQTRFAH